MMRPQGAIYGWDRQHAAQLHALRQGGRGARRPRRVRRAARADPPGARARRGVGQARAGERDHPPGPRVQGRDLRLAASLASRRDGRRASLAARGSALDADARSRPGSPRSGPLAVVDFETTGLAEDAAAEPIEFGAVLLDPGRAPRHDARADCCGRAGRVPRAVQRADRPRRRRPRRRAAHRGGRAGAIAAALAGRTIVAHNADFERHFLARYVAPSLRSARYLDTQELLALAHPDAPDLRLETCARAPARRARAATARSPTRSTPRALLSLAAARRARGRARATRRRAPRSSATRRDSPWLALLRGAARCRPREREPAQYIAIPPSARAAGALRRRRDRRGARRRGARPAPLPGLPRARGRRSAWRASSCACSTTADACCSRAAPASGSRSPTSRARSPSRWSAPPAACASR